MLSPEVVFPGELPEDPREMMRGFKPHIVPPRNLVIDGDSEAITRMESSLGITYLRHGAAIADLARVEKSDVLQSV